MTLKNAMETLYIQLDVAGDRIGEAEKKAIKVMFMDYSMTGIQPEMNKFSGLGSLILFTACRSIKNKSKHKGVSI